MTAEKLDDITISLDDIDPFDAADDLTVDVRRPATGAQVIAIAHAHNVIDGDELPVVLEAQRLARGTEPLQEAVGFLDVAKVERALSPPDPDEHLACSVALHESLTSLLELVAMIEQQGGHTWPWQQQAVWRAKQLLERHGRR